MTAELTVLALAGLLQVAQFGLMAVPVNLQLGTAYTASSREAQLQPHGAPGRLFRAMNNHFEGLILFTLAVVVVVLGQKTSAFTAGCAWTYLIARVLYVAAYGFGVAYLRSLIWSVGFLATTFMLIAALL